MTDDRAPDLPDDSPDDSPFAAVVQFFLVPLAVVGVSVALFLAFSALTGERHGLADYLQEVRTASHPRNNQAAYELSRRVAADPEAARESGIGPLVIQTFEQAEGEDPEVRRYLASVLGALREPAAVEPLVGALDDGDPETRGFAAWALGALGEPAVPPLVERLETEEAHDVRSLVALALGRIGDPSAVPQLVVAMEQAHHPAAAWQAAFAVAQCGSDASASLLRKLLEPGYVSGTPGITEAQVTEVRVNAIRALARVASAEDRRLLERLGADDEDLKVRRMALDAASELDAQSSSSTSP